MNWKRFNLLNNVLGWLVAGVAAVVYLLTIEPTASLWDCAEFVACDYRLEVGHPPGAPFYMLVYNVVSHLAPSPQEAALYANATSAIISALCILFLFWTLTHLLRRLINYDFRLENADRGAGAPQLTPTQSLLIFGGAAVGSLVYTFSDTFWFSAVEAEVYAFSSLFTAVVFWLMFKWEERADEEGSDRWIILMAYLMGLSIGVHLLNLLCLPAMALIYYYRKAKLPTLWGAAKSVLVSFALIVAMMYGVVQGVPKMAGRFDWLFVNELGFSFNSGLFFYLGLVLAVLAWSVFEAYRSVQAGAVSLRLFVASVSSIILMGIPFLGDGYVLGFALSALLIGLGWYYRAKLSTKLVQTVQLSLLAIAIGFSSYGVILVRAIADTPMNENAPANAFSLRYYLAREQYVSAPLLYGPSFASKPKGLVTSKEVLGKAPKTNPSDPDKYTKLSDQPEPEYDSKDKMLFPRVYSRGHAQYYNSWMGRDEADMSAPTFADNLRYFFSYQLNYMYWRYFMWNFVGRQNDIQGQGDLMNGNAITGINFIDKFLVGDQESLPDHLKANKGRNVYYALPLLFGLLGMYYQVSRTRSTLRLSDEERSKLERDKQLDKATPIGHQSFWIVFMLFVMTGLAIVVYLNQTPGQPRERDYAFAGSFYAFALWIGMGVPALWSLLRRLKMSELPAAALATALALIIPIQMAGQNWDDHDRSGRTIARDAGINYLESLEPNAILFCYGDNDTFPLWYIQDVEGVRRDVRTMNLSYLGGDWYIDQMRRKTYTGEPVPLKYMTPDLYYFHEVAYVGEEEPEELPSLDDALRQVSEQKGAEELIVPYQRMMLKVDSAALAKTLPYDIAKDIVPEMEISLQGKRYLDRGGLTVLDLINANQWKRPIYWTSTSPRDAFSNLPGYMLQTGMAYQLLPIKTPEEGRQRNVRLKEMYNNVMKKFRFGGADNPKVYMDETARNMLSGIRNNVFVPLAEALYNEGEHDKAKEVLTKCLKMIRPETVPYDSYSMRLANMLYEVGMTAEADRINKDIVHKSVQTIDWMLALNEMHLQRILSHGQLDEAYYTLSLGASLAERFGSEALKPYEAKIKLFRKLIGQEPAEEELTELPEPDSTTPDGPAANIQDTATAKLLDSSVATKGAQN